MGLLNLLNDQENLLELEAVFFRGWNAHFNSNSDTLLSRADRRPSLHLDSPLVRTHLLRRIRRRQIGRGTSQKSMTKSHIEPLLI